VRGAERQKGDVYSYIVERIFHLSRLVDVASSHASQILLVTSILAIARARSFISAIGAFGEVRSLCGLDFAFFLAGGFVQAAGSFFALLGRCVLNSHRDFLLGPNAAKMNDQFTSNVPRGAA
jgi:hypothetical protein